MVGFPNNYGGFPTKNDQTLGCEMFFFPTILGNTPYNKTINHYMGLKESHHLKHHLSYEGRM